MSEFIERAVHFEPLAERADGDGDGKTLEGYAAVFDADTEINSWEGHFKERISRGAFRKTLRERTPIMQYDHGHDIRFGKLPIGVYESVKEDRHGLKVQGRLFEHAEPIREAIAAGAVTGMSFKFRVVRDQWFDKAGNEIKDRNELVDLLYGGDKKRGPLQRTIKEVKLMEAGPVTTPAYAQTTVGVRSSMNDDERRRAIETMVREGDNPEPEGEFDEGSRASVEALVEGGMPREDAEAYLRGENPFAKKGEAEKCDKCTDKAKCEKHKKTSSGKGEAKPPMEKKSEDVTSEAPEEGSDADAEREEQDPDAAQAGTSGLTKNARERALFLLEMEGKQ